MIIRAALLFTGCILTLSSIAEAAQVRFRGGMTLTAVSNCRYLFVGQTFTTSFRPASTTAVPLGDNPQITSIAHFEPYSGDLYQLNGRFLVNQWQTLKASGLANEGYQYSAAIKVTSQTPATIQASTQFVTLTGQIQNASNDPGVSGNKCLASFRASFFRRYEY